MSILSFMQRWLQVQPASRPIGTRDVPSGERVEEGDVLALSAAYACVRLLSGVEASLPVQVLKDASGDGQTVQVRDHWAHRLLRQAPSEELTAFDLFEGIGSGLELKGNALARKELSGDRVIALEPMSWDETRVYRKRDGSIAYDWRGETLSSDEVLHIRGFGGDALGGLSTISVAAATFGLAKAINRSAGSVFKNGIRTQTALVSDRDLTPEQMEQARTIVEERYAGAMNAGRPLVLNNGLKAVPLQMNPEDAQMLESRGFSVEEVCRFFGVPPHMIGHTAGNTTLGSSIAEQTLGFHKFSLGPRLARIEQSMTKQLLSAADLAAGIKIGFNVEGLLRSSSKERSDFYGSAIDKGWMTRNEVRRKENLPPIAGGDTVTVQMQQVPLGASTTPPAASN